jgi:hypothetical protein
MQSMAKKYSPDAIAPRLSAAGGNLLVDVAVVGVDGAQEVRPVDLAVALR